MFGPNPQFDTRGHCCQFNSICRRYFFSSLSSVRLYKTLPALGVPLTPRWGVEHHSHLFISKQQLKLPEATRDQIFMKTVSGKVLSAKPVSLSKAAKILSGFASVENGASDAVSVYLHRASDSFNSLVQFHKELKTPYSHRKRQSSRALDYDARPGNLDNVEENPDGENVKILENPRKGDQNGDFALENEGPLKIERNPDGVDGHEGEKDLVNRRSGQKNRDLGFENDNSIKIEQSLDGVGEKRKQKKHRKEKLKNEEPRKIDQSPDGVEGDEVTKVLDGGGKGKKIKQERMGVEREADGVEESSPKRKEKRKRKKSEIKETGQSLEVARGDNGEWKRKSGDVDDGASIDFTDQGSKKKRKRRKTEGD